MATTRLAAAALFLILLGGPGGAQEASSDAPAPPRFETKETQAALTPEAALERLRGGNQRFSSNATLPRDWSAKVIATAAGQYPFAIVLGCMDSRAPMEIIFDRANGSVFGVRVAANV